MSQIVFKSQERTASTNSQDVGSQPYIGGIFFIDVTAISGTGASLTLMVQRKDTVTGKYVTLISTTAITVVGTTSLTVYPGITTSANVAISNVLSDEFRVVATIGGTTPSVTFSVVFDGLRS